MPSESTARIAATIAAVPRGKVASYGQIAAAAGMPGGARQVVRVLHSRSEKDELPWFRVLRSDGSIALPRGGGFELQKALLEAEGVKVSPGGVVDESAFAWGPARRRGVTPSAKASARRKA